MIHPKYFHTKKTLRFILLGLRYVLPKDKFLYFHERLLKSNYPNHTKHYSQGGQDLFVDMLLKAKTGGTFIEIGANDGILYSNTLFFERERKWTGVCVEPNPFQYKKLVQNRKAFCIQACVGSCDGVVSFPAISDEELSLLGKSQSNSDEGMVHVQQIDLPHLFSLANVSNVDFMSIDTEGSEHEILTSLSTIKNRPKVIAVEENISHELLDLQMGDLGYDVIAKVYTDRIYLNRI